MKRYVLVWALLICFIPMVVSAGQDKDTAPVTLTGFDELRDLAQSKRMTFDPSAAGVQGILDYVIQRDQSETPTITGGLEHSPVAYQATDLKIGFKDVLRYCFNPDVPSCAMFPSMIRVSCWRPSEGFSPLPQLWTQLDDLTDPQIVHGTFYMQNTPDSRTGAYYGYDSYRTLILMKYKGRNTLISILKQVDVSDVGKKGYVLEDKDVPEFFYSGERGLTKRGLGWIKSYLYDSFSVAVYAEDPQKKGITRYGVFKWINAGWAGKNMVRAKHIQKGLIRHEEVFKEVIESESRPSPEVLAQICQAYSRISPQEIKTKMAEHLEGLMEKCSSSYDCPKSLTKNFDPDGYLITMSLLEMRATLMVAAIKQQGPQSEKPGNVACRSEVETATVF